MGTLNDTILAQVHGIPAWIAFLTYMYEVRQAGPSSQSHQPSDNADLTNLY